MNRPASMLMGGASPVLMLCRNALELTKRAIDSVRAQDIPVRIHVISNHSTDGTDQWLEEQPDIMTTIFRPALGVSAGWNTGLSSIFRNYDHCFVLNNDIELRADCLRSLLEDGGLFVTAVSVDNVGGIQGEWRNNRRNHPDFSAWLMRRDAWLKVGGFDESMVLYASDADMHLRMFKVGIPAYTIGIPFFHHASGTLKSANPSEKARICEQADRDRETFERKWGFAVGSTAYYAAFGHGAPDETR